MINPSLYLISLSWVHCVIPCIRTGSLSKFHLPVALNSVSGSNPAPRLSLHGIREPGALTSSLHLRHSISGTLEVVEEGTRASDFFFRQRLQRAIANHISGAPPFLDRLSPKAGVTTRSDAEQPGASLISQSLLAAPTVPPPRARSRPVLGHKGTRRAAKMKLLNAPLPRHTLAPLSSSYSSPPSRRSHWQPRTTRRCEDVPGGGKTKTPRPGNKNSDSKYFREPGIDITMSHYDSRVLQGLDLLRGAPAEPAAPDPLVPDRVPLARRRDRGSPTARCWAGGGTARSCRGTTTSTCRCPTPHSPSSARNYNRTVHEYRATPTPPPANPTPW